MHVIIDFLTYCHAVICDVEVDDWWLFLVRLGRSSIVFAREVKFMCFEIETIVNCCLTKKTVSGGFV